MRDLSAEITTWCVASLPWEGSLSDKHGVSRKSGQSHLRGREFFVAPSKEGSFMHSQIGYPPVPCRQSEERDPSYCLLLFPLVLVLINVDGTK